MPNDNSSFVSDDLKFRTITALLHTLSAIRNTKKNDSNRFTRWRRDFRLLLACAVLLWRDGDDVACIPRRTNDEVVVFVGRTPVSKNENEGKGTVELFDCEEVKLSEVTRAGVVQFLIANWGDVDFYKHASLVAALLTESEDSHVAHKALGDYALITHVAQLSDRFYLDRYRSVFAMVNIASFDSPPAIEILSRIDEHERWILRALLEARRDKQGEEQEVEEYPVMVRLLQTHQLADEYGVVGDFLNEFQHLLCRLLLNVEVALPPLMEVQGGLKIGRDTPDRAKLTRTIAELDSPLQVLSILAWESKIFRWYIGTFLGRYFQTLAPEVVENLDPQDHHDDTKDLRPSAYADVCDFYHFEPVEVKASPSIEWLYWFRLITSPVYLPTLFFDTDLPPVRVRMLEYSPPSREMLPWRDCIKWIYRYHHLETENDAISVLEAQFANGSEKNFIANPSFIPEFTTHPEAVLATVRHLAKEDRHDSFLKLFHNTPSLISTSAPCCGVCMTIMEVLVPHSTKVRWLPTNGDIIPSALPMHLPQQVSTKVIGHMANILKREIEKLSCHQKTQEKLSHE